MILDKFYEANIKSKQPMFDIEQSPRARTTSQTNNARIASARIERSAPLKIPAILKINSLDEFFAQLEKEQAVSLRS